MKYEYRTEAWCDCGEEDVEVLYHETLDDTVEHLRSMVWETREPDGIHVQHITIYKED